MATSISSIDPFVSTSILSDFVQAGLTPYAEQVEMAVMMDDTMSREDGSIALIEAPTATGKTLVMARQALSIAASSDDRVVIAAPSVELCHNMTAALDRLRSANPAYGRVTTAMALGRQEYVSATGGADFAQAEDEAGNADAAATIRKWLSDQASMRQHAGPAYAKKDLERALDAAGVAIREVPDWTTLAHFGREDPAQTAYEEAFSSGDVTVVTHAMLTRDLIRRYVSASKLRKTAGIATKHRGAEWWMGAARERLEFETDVDGHLPDYRHLVVDEAHLLRDNVSLAMTTSFSIRKTISNVERLRGEHPRSVPAWVLPVLARICETMTESGTARRGDRLRIGWLRDRGYGTILEDLQKALDAVKWPKSTSLLHETREIRRAALALKQSLGARDGVATTLQWSPYYSYPSVSVGPYEVRSELHFLWGRLKSAALVSATLYVDNKDGPSARWLMDPLGISPDTTVAWPRIEADWMTRDVTLVTPSNEQAKAFSPPRHDACDKAWTNTMAGAIVQAHARTEQGGLLVLSTSRRLTERLCMEVSGLISADVPVIDGTVDRISVGKTRFETLARAGSRPIWISQGPAWTGLDIADDAIEAVLIPRLPFPPPRPGSTTLDEIRYDGTNVNEMLVRLRQGLGRLVRSRTHAPKTTYVLDGRMTGSTIASAARYVLNRHYNRNDVFQ